MTAAFPDFDHFRVSDVVAYTGESRWTSQVTMLLRDRILRQPRQVAAKWIERIKATSKFDELTMEERLRCIMIEEPLNDVISW